MAGNERKTDFGERQRAVVCFLVAVCLGGMAALFYFADTGLFHWLSLVPAGLGLLMLWVGVHALLASATPSTTVVLDPEVLAPGGSGRVVIRQGGPVRLESLRANLVCERIERPAGRSRTVTYPCQKNFFDSGACEVSSLEVREFSSALTVPADAEASVESAGLVVCWRIEVWGKVRGRADFLRPFSVTVE